MKKHGLHNCPEHAVWRQMKQRCYNVNSQSYINYGARGISVCEGWINSFSKFISDLGRRPSKKHSLDRINNNGNYEPTNCVWSLKREQNRNMRKNVYVNFNGEKMLLADFARSINVPLNKVWHHIRKKGRTVEYVINFYKE